MIPFYSCIALFFLSGIAGLIYESIWAQYLKLLLGHAAYAQTVVLAIYMSGMSIGAWIAGSKLHRISKPLETYAIVEFILGITAFLFHTLFVSYQEFSYTTVIPFLGGRVPVFFYKWISGAMFILPQSILLGATFPLMVAGIIRRFPVGSGYDIATFYCANTLGASLGVLLSGFFLIGAVGLNGTIAAAGCIDIFVAGGMYIFCKYMPWLIDDAPEAGSVTPMYPPILFPTQSAYTVADYYKPLMIIAGLTAASSFMYELGWIRMLSLVLGSSTHSFEMMLSTFILGMAAGSFFIRKKIETIANIPRTLVLVQVIMGIGALISVFVYSYMFHLMQFFMSALRNNNEGYFFFNLFSDFICMLVMLPTTICAGMVLPLIIQFYYTTGSGERYIGKIYSINTIGGIIGIAISVWLLIPLVGIRFLILIGGLIDIGIGIYILYSFKVLEASSGLKQLVPAFCLLIIFFSVIFGRVDPVLAASGVFRNGTIAHHINVITHKDGRTATISLYKSNDNLVLATNGKPDAGINVHGGICGDEYTMALCGVLPMSIVPDGARAALIGLGSGMTAHFLLYDSTLESLDIIEIEPEMAVAARKIGAKVENAFTDKRAKLHIDDAKSFFSTCARKYEIIISEPSNPWVSGISGLFSVEFFGRIKEHLSDNGVLVQWFHRYESDISIITSIFSALQQHFPSYRLYAIGSDFILLASKNVNADLDFKRDPFSITPLAERLNDMHFFSLNDFSLLRFASDKTIGRLTRIFPAPPNSDYVPYIDLHAVKYRFIDDNIKQLDTLYQYIIPVRKIIETDTAFIPLYTRDCYPDLSNFGYVAEAKKIYREIMSQEQFQQTVSPDISSAALQLAYTGLSPAGVHFDVFFGIILEILEKTLPYLSPLEMQGLWNKIAEKCSNMNLSVNDQAWMDYFKALCSYEIPALRELSADLLPTSGSIEDDYVHRMLLTSLILSSILQGDTKTASQYLSRFKGKKNPGMIIELCYALRQYSK